MYRKGKFIKTFQGFLRAGVEFELSANGPQVIRRVTEMF